MNLNNQLVLMVEDSGPGIQKSMRENVLKRFYRTSDAISKGIIGSGLGLTIVAQILSAHDAKLTLADSELGGLLVKINFSNSNTVSSDNES
jgi:signal transduction histidine kinase